MLCHLDLVPSYYFIFLCTKQLIASVPHRFEIHKRAGDSQTQSLGPMTYCTQSHLMLVNIFSKHSSQGSFSMRTPMNFVITLTQMELTVSSMTWKARADPGFVVATFRWNGRGVSVSYCPLARESHILIAYASVLVLLLLIMPVANTPQLSYSR